jgi:glycosyltransferase involved in cell wall biosynthesis
MKYPLIRFLIVGEGTEKQMLTERCLELGIGQCVEFVGGVKESEMASLLRSADLYVSTSPLDAGLAASTSEAMASGLPIIHPNTADNQFWSDNTSGRLFEVGNVHSLSSAIIELLECSYEWKEMGKRNRTRIVNDNNIDSILQNMNVGYHKLLEIKNK